ncbi:TPA: phage portal protein [Burkholderia vietnamiensis]|nr:phage portal protein [Burkholderia vietnamiensis]
MTALAFILQDDVPEALAEHAQRAIVDDVLFVTYPGAPIAGEVSERPDGIIEVVYQWSKAAEPRHTLGDWLTANGITFTVIH